MNKSDLISIVIPVYNAEKYLRKCLNSLINQSYRNLEIICVNDGSKDKSKEILEEYSKMDQRIKVFHQENQGALQTRKNGVNKISNESCFFMFCDADDVMPYNSIELLYTYVKKENSEICVGNTIRLFRDYKIKSAYLPKIFQGERVKNYGKQDFLNELYCSWFGVSNIPVSLCGKIYDTCKFKSIFLNVPNIVNFFGEDLISTLNIFPLAEKITFITDVVYCYRIGGGSSKYQPLMMEDWISLYKYKYDFSCKYPMPQDIQYLMDVELCNMTFTFFEMLLNTSGFTKDKVLLEIEKVCTIPEIIKASNNKTVMLKNNLKATLIREERIDEIYNFIIQNDRKKKLIRILKNLLLKFS